MHKYLTFLFIFISAVVLGQNKLSDEAQRLYLAKNYAKAGPYFLASARQTEFKAFKSDDLYNAACCYSLSGKADSALILLKEAVNDGYKNFAHLKVDSDFIPLHNLPGWISYTNSLHAIPASSNDPNKAKFITTDVKLFWQAYDKAQADTANRRAIYKNQYADAGSPGLQDYFAYKVKSMKEFMVSHDAKLKFYAGIRKNTLTVDAQKPRMRASFVKLKELYPKAGFPNIYFVIGAFSSGGTSTDNGLLIGLDQAVRTPDVPVDELSRWELNNFGQLKYLPNLVAHELIHYNQNGMANDTTLLHGVLIEGMADFIGELISGRTANERLQVWAKGKEKKIWADFEKEMYLKRSYNWIANADQETVDKPADIGYWVGYQICKGYYENSTEKKQAIYDMLNIKDYKAFYERSGTSQKFLK
jgi:hypothetical protein